MYMKKKKKEKERQREKESVSEKRGGRRRLKVGVRSYKKKRGREERE